MRDRRIKCGCGHLPAVKDWGNEGVLIKMSTRSREAQDRGAWGMLIGLNPCWIGPWTRGRLHIDHR